MAKKKLKMELIKDQKALLVTYNKRKANLLKKISELSILCGIDACIIILGPQLGHRQCAGPETWPSDSTEVKRILDRFIRTNQPRRCSYVSDYFADKKKKIDSEIAELKEKNYRAKYQSWHQILDTFSQEQLRAFVVHLNGKLEIAVQRLQMLRQIQLQQSSRSEMVHNNVFFTNLLASGAPRPSDCRIPTFGFYPENGQWNPNLIDMNVDQNNNIYTTKFPFNFETMVSSYRPPLMEDVMMNNQNGQYSGLTYATPLSWMRSNDVYIPDQVVQPMVPGLQPSLQPNIPYQLHLPQSSELNGRDEGHEWNWRVEK